MCPNTSYVTSLQKWRRDDGCGEVVFLIKLCLSGG